MRLWKKGTRSMKAISLIAFLTFGCASYNVKPDPIRDPILAKLPLFRECWIASKTYETSEDKTGSVTLKFRIEKDGTVTNLKLEDSKINDLNLTNCILVHAASIKYQASATYKDVSQPIKFFP